jgi:hypothetical protein
VYGRPIVSSETFDVTLSNAYGTTPETMKRISDSLFVGGINEIVMHGFGYVYRISGVPRFYPFPRPGWHPFLTFPFPLHLNDQIPYWRYIRNLTDYMTRIQMISQRGNRSPEIAVLRTALAYDSLPNIPPEGVLIEGLTAIGYDADYLNASALEKCSTTDRHLIAPSGTQYSALIVPGSNAIRFETALHLSKIQAGGVPVFFVGEVPSQEEGYKDYASKSDHIKKLLAGAKSVPDNSSAFALISSIVAPSVQFSGDSSNIGWLHKRLLSIDFYFFTNSSAEAQDVSVTLTGHGSPSSWDPWSGKITPETSFQSSDDSVSLKISLPPYGSQLIAIDPADSHPSVPQSQNSEIVLNTGDTFDHWTLTAEGINLDGTRDVFQLELNQLGDWVNDPRLLGFSGDGHYQTTLNLTSSDISNYNCIVLDLGQVADIATLLINGSKVGTRILQPYQFDVKPFLVVGANKIEIIVTNSLTNRLLAADVPLKGPGPQVSPQSSGLLRPVMLLGQP